MNDALLHQENRAAHALMGEVQALITARDASPAVALLTPAKLLGQTVVFLDPRDPAELLDCAMHVARDEMRLRSTAARLEAAGLGAIMPVYPV